VALAFGLGYGIRRLAEDDDGGGTGARSEQVSRFGVTFRQAASVPFDITSRQLLRRFEGKPHATRRHRARDLTCFVYVVSDRPATGWRFCFRDGRLASSSTSPL
jgi:hypothetical protein